MDTNEFDFVEDTTIDPNALDVAWLQQSNLVLRYTKAVADAEKEVKDCHEELKTIRSDLVKDANLDPEGCLGKGIKKATNPLVEAYYRTHDNYIEAKDALIEAEYKRDLIQGAKQAVFGNKAALEGLIKLLGMDYFSGPKEPRDLKTEFEKKAKENRKEAAGDRVRSRQTRRSK